MSIFTNDKWVQGELDRLFGSHDPRIVALRQAKPSFLVFNRTNDTSLQYGSPKAMLDAPTAALFVGGTALCLAWALHPALAWPVISLLGIVVVGAMLTMNAPFWPRLAGTVGLMSIPPMILADRGLALLERLWRPLARWVGIPLVVVWLAGVGWLNYRYYFHEFCATPHYFLPPTVLGQYVASLPPDALTVLLGRGVPVDHGHKTLEYLAAGRRVIPAETLDALQRETVTAPIIAFIVYEGAWREQFLPELRRRFPAALLEEHRLPTKDRPVFFYSYVIDRAQFEQYFVTPPPASEPPPPAGVPRFPPRKP